MSMRGRPLSSTLHSRKTSPLSPKLEKNLLAYAVAAGGGLIALSQAADAQVVYTPSNIPITEAYAGTAVTSFDINNDGTPDFNFTEFQYNSMGFGGYYLRITPLQNSNEIVGILIKGENQTTAAALDGGVQVGPNANFQSSPSGLFMAGVFFGTSAGPPLGSWRQVETAYLGLKFVVDNQVHYGWARIKFVYPGGYSYASISGYAYEATPNQPINTGQTSSTAKNRTISQMDRTMVPAGTAGEVRAELAADRNLALGMLALGAAGRNLPSPEPILP